MHVCSHSHALFNCSPTPSSQQRNIPTLRATNWLPFLCVFIHTHVRTLQLLCIKAIHSTYHVINLYLVVWSFCKPYSETFEWGGGGDNTRYLVISKLYIVVNSKRDFTMHFISMVVTVYRMLCLYTYVCVLRYWLLFLPILFPFLSFPFLSFVFISLLSLYHTFILLFSLSPFLLPSPVSPSTWGWSRSCRRPAPRHPPTVPPHLSCPGNCTTTITMWPGSARCRWISGECFVLTHNRQSDPCFGISGKKRCAKHCLGGYVKKML